MTPEQQAAIERAMLRRQQQAAIERAQQSQAAARAQQKATPQIPEGHFLNTDTGQYTTREMLRNSNEPSRSRAYVGGGMQGLAMEGADELYGLTGGLDADERKFKTENMRAVMEADQAEYPGSFLTGQIAGGAVTGASYGIPAMQGRGMGGAMLGGGLVGAGEGAISGFLSGEGADDRAYRAAMGTGIGGVLGAMAAPAGALAGQVVDMGKSAWKNSGAKRQIAQLLGVSPDTAEVVAKGIGGTNENAARGLMAKSGDGAMLGDVMPGQLDEAINSPTPGAKIGAKRVDDRAQGAYERVLDALNGGKQGPQMPPRTTQKAMAAANRPNVHPLYQSAYSTPIDYSSEAGRSIEELMSRIPGDQAKAAIKKAREQMIFDGFPNEQIMASIGDDGVVKFTKPPNVMQLDYMKRAFDKIAEDSKDVAGRMSSDGMFAGKIARSIREKTADAVPVYREALAAAADDIRGRAAVDTGRKMTSSSLTVEDALEAISDATPAELRAMRAGVRGQIDHVMGNVRAVASDQNIDARQAQKLYSDLSSPNTKQKLEALFGDEWPEVASSLDNAGVALGLRANIARNSATQPRQRAAMAIDDAIDPGPVMGMRPVEAPMEILRRFTKSDKGSLDRAGERVRSEIAELLTRPGGDKALDAIYQALSRHMMDPRSGEATRAVVSGLGVGSTPSLNDLLQQKLGPSPPR